VEPRLFAFPHIVRTHAMKILTSPLLLTLLLVSCSSGSGGGGPVIVAHMGGAWSGHWSSVTGQHGTLRIDLAHAGTAIAGSASLTDSPCFSGVMQVTGQVDEVARTVTGDLRLDSDRIHFIAYLSNDANVLTGTYDVPGHAEFSCRGDTGTLSVSRPPGTRNDRAIRPRHDLQPRDRRLARDDLALVGLPRPAHRGG